MYPESDKESADELLNRLVLIFYRKGRIDGRWSWAGHEMDPGQNEHLRSCPHTAVTKALGYDGSYCESGCEYVRLEATLSCPHGESEEYEAGGFGDISWMIEDMERLAK